MTNNAIEPAESPDPISGRDSECSGVFHKGSGVFNSMASLTPSNLDQAIMEMLNIKPQAGIRGVCDGGFIGKQSCTMFPIILNI